MTLVRKVIDMKRAVLEFAYYDPVWWILVGLFVFEYLGMLLVDFLLLILRLVLFHNVIRKSGQNLDSLYWMTSLG